MANPSLFGYSPPQAQLVGAPGMTAGGMAPGPMVNSSANIGQMFGSSLNAGANSSPMSGAGNGSFDWGGLLGNVLGSIGNNAGNLAGGIAGNNIATNAYDRAMNAAGQIQYNPSNINSLFGNVSTAQNPNGSWQYGLNPNSAGTTMLNASNGLINAGNQYTQYAGDPNSIAAQMYQNLTNLSQPGEKTATQNLFDTLQANGRLGLTQNGQLGDIGGMQLAQQQADEQRRLDSMNYGNTLVQQRAQLGSALTGQGMNGLLNTNAALNSLIPMSMQGGYGPMTAAADRGQLAVGAANTLANNQANQLAGTMQGLQMNGGTGFLGQIGNKVGSWLGNKISGAAGNLLGDALGTAAPTLGLGAMPVAADVPGALSSLAAGTPALPASIFGGAGAGAAALGGGAGTLGAGYTSSIGSALGADLGAGAGYAGLGGVGAGALGAGYTSSIGTALGADLGAGGGAAAAGGAGAAAGLGPLAWTGIGAGLLGAGLAIANNTQGHTDAAGTLQPGQYDVKATPAGQGGVGQANLVLGVGNDRSQGSGQFFFKNPTTGALTGAGRNGTDLMTDLSRTTPNWTHQQTQDFAAWLANAPSGAKLPADMGYAQAAYNQLMGDKYGPVPDRLKTYFGQLGGQQGTGMDYTTFLQAIAGLGRTVTGNVWGG